MTKENIKTDVLVLGSGPAGNTAAIYTVRAGLKTAIVHGFRPGGQLTITTDVENFPGFVKPIKGHELMDNMIEQGKNLGVNVISDMITKVNFDQKPIICEGESGNTYETKALIISTGAETRWLGIPGEEEFKGFGVSGCAICDGPFFRNQTVCVVGGGASAVEEALYLSKIAKKVYLIHRKDSLRAEQVEQDKLFENEKIEVLWDTTVEEIIGKDMPKMVTKIKIKNAKTGKESELEMDGIFMAIGYSPSTGIFKDSKLKINDKGYIVTENDSAKTNIPGVFAAGDVADKKYKQAVIAAGYGAVAAFEAEKYIDELKNK